jgi:predicted dinucleotide-binding enzyme
MLSHLVESLGEEIQRTFPDTRVVKTLCTVDARLMVAPDSVEGPSTLFLSGDDTDAKRTVRALLNDLGWSESSLLDLGGIGPRPGVRSTTASSSSASPAPSATTASAYGSCPR